MIVVKVNIICWIVKLIIKKFKLEVKKFVLLVNYHPKPVPVWLGNLTETRAHLPITTWCQRWDLNPRQYSLTRIWKEVTHILSAVFMLNPIDSQSKESSRKSDSNFVSHLHQNSSDDQSGELEEGGLISFHFLTAHFELDNSFVYFA